ncbi:MAG: ATP-binding cassette domain-containing protein [Cyclobacteriaceae bacterium]|nr:ATP-binding cassette domain-containing protein [Cyclobacteriaceae bacterium]
MINISIAKKLSGATGELNLHFHATILTGELITIYGPSGAGKTSILRMLAGLLEPDSGHIQVDDAVWFDKDKSINLKPQRRNIGMVFQEYSLFPNMTVRENLEFALNKGQSKSIVDELLELTELWQLQNKKPATLSGGQMQRIALARALIRKPKLLLLDEPLSALDTEMQSKLQDYILELHQQFDLTTIVVTHDLIEVIKMSKRVLIIEEGRIAKDGMPLDVLPLRHLKSLL